MTLKQFYDVMLALGVIAVFLALIFDNGDVAVVGVMCAIAALIGYLTVP